CQCGGLDRVAWGSGSGQPTRASLVSRTARADEQGRVQGAASALESLGRTLGPVWGNASLQHVGDATPFVSAAGFLAVTLALCVGFRAVDLDGAATAPTIGRRKTGLRDAELKFRATSDRDRGARVRRRSDRGESGGSVEPASVRPRRGASLASCSHDSGTARIRSAGGGSARATNAGANDGRRDCRTGD